MESPIIEITEVETIDQNADEPENKQDFKTQILEAHNKRRKAHGSPALRSCSELDVLAQSWADRLAKQAHISFSELSGVGENITFFPREVDAERIVEHWYVEHEKYEYETPGWQAGTNYFTQVVWKTTEEIGIGRAFVENEPDEDGRKSPKMNGKIAEPLDQVVVAFYRPSGNNNRAGQFAVNVQKPLVPDIQ